MNKLYVALALLLSACGGAQLVPLVEVPLLRRAGQVEGGLVVRPASPRAELGGTIRVAASEHLRLGASLVGATRRPDARALEQEGVQRHPVFHAHGFVGAEWGGLLLRFGALVGSGYGVGERVGSGCVLTEGARSCVEGERVASATRYVRSYGQLHVALAPPGPLATSFALRIPFVADLTRHGRAREAREVDVSPELAVTQSLLLRYLRLDLQPAWSYAQGFSFHLVLLARLEAHRRAVRSR